MNVKIALCAIFVVMGATFLVEAKYDISSYTIDNGGAVSTGGAYIVRGTIGQPDAAYSEGENQNDSWLRSGLARISCL